MADRLRLPDPDLQALVAGTVIVAFTTRHVVDLNDELELVAIGPRPIDELAAGHATLAMTPAPEGDYLGLVVGLQPAASLAGAAGSAHHILASVPDGDAVILRVFSGEGPVVADADFERRRAAVEAMFG